MGSKDTKPTLKMTNKLGKTTALTLLTRNTREIRDMLCPATRSNAQNISTPTF